MEKKKILLVTISVGVFLVIVIGAALLIFGTQNSYPGAVANRPIAAGSSSVAYTAPDAYLYGDLPPALPEANPYGEVQGPGIVVVTEGDDNSARANNGSSNGVSSNGSVNGTSSNGVSGSNGSSNGAASSGSANSVSSTSSSSNSVPSSSVPASTVAQTSGSSTVISVNRPSTAAVPDTTPPPASASTAQTAPARPAASSSSIAQTTAAASSAVSSSSASTAAVPASAAVKNTTDYWVQAGSFSTLSRAEGVKSTLLDKGFTSIIENRTIDGTMYYRVRIGPYTSKNEADYWLALVQTINGFEQSQVWQSQ
jgi:DedD protein